MSKFFERVRPNPKAPDFVSQSGEGFCSNLSDLEGANKNNCWCLCVTYTLEPKNKGVEDDVPFQWGDFQVP